MTPKHTQAAAMPRHLQQGFTLIELMIVVTVVAILAAVAIPSYTEYIQRSHRSNARSALQQAAQWMERAATAQGSYPLTAAVPAGILVVEGGRYTMTVVSTATAYTFTATATGVQASDKCGNFTLNQAGVRGVSGTLSVEECWNR